MKKIPLIVILSIIILGSLYFFFPKERVQGGLRGGPIAKGESSELVEYSCLGIKYDYCPTWPDYGCDYLCFGYTYNRKCYVETAEQAGTQKSEMNCK